MEDWTPDQTVIVKEKGDCGDYFTALFWIVPAKVDGIWKLPQGDLTLKQTFQTFSGTLKSGAKTVPVTNGKLTGDVISFSVGNAKYAGKVSGNTMQGTLESGGSPSKWTAMRVGKAL
jgi:hypothetical protein